MSGQGYYDEEKYAQRFFEMFIEYFWMHDDPYVQMSFKEYFSLWEWEEQKRCEGILPDYKELLGKERVFVSLLQGLDIQAYQLFRRAMERIPDNFFDR